MQRYLVKLVRDGTTFHSRSSDFEFERLLPYFMCGDKELTSQRLAERTHPTVHVGAQSFFVSNCSRRSAKV